MKHVTPTTLQIKQNAMNFPSFQTHTHIYKNVYKYTNFEEKSDYLDEDSAISIGMGVNGASGSLAANVASKGYAHSPTWRFRE